MLGNLTNLLVMRLLNELRALDIVFKGLNSIEAASLILFHGVRRLILENMPNHCLVTLRIELVIISRGDIGKFLVIGL